MNPTLKFSLKFLLFLIYFPVAGQQHRLLSNIKTGSLANVKAIVNDGKIKGYFAYYPLEKSGKKSFDYEIEILDNNLKTTHSLVISSTKSAKLINGEYNGKHFCFTFYDYKNTNHNIEHFIVDQEAKLITTIPHETKVLSSFNLKDYPSTEDAKNFVYPIPNIGFARIKRVDKHQRRSVIEVFGSDGKNIWESDPFDESKYTDKVDFRYADSSRLDVTIMYASGFDALFYQEKCKFVSFNSKDGSIIIKREFPLDKIQLDIYKTNYNQKNNRIEISGTYAKGSYNSGKDGVFKIIIDSTGNFTEKYNSWEKEINEKIKVKSGNRLENNTIVYFHESIEINSKYYFIGEEIKNTHTTSNQGEKIILRDIFIICLNTDFNIDSIYIFEKSKSTIYVAETDTRSLSKKDLLDFKFLIENNTQDNFTATFVTFDKILWKETGSTFTIHNITLNTEGSLIDLTYTLNTKPTFFTVLPAKQGYIALYEYFSKDKSADFRLEKLDY